MNPAPPITDEKLERDLSFARWKVRNGIIAQQYASDYVLGLLNEVWRLRSCLACIRSRVERIDTDEGFPKDPTGMVMFAIGDDARTGLDGTWPGGGWPPNDGDDDPLAPPASPR